MSLQHTKKDTLVEMRRLLRQAAAPRAARHQVIVLYAHQHL